MSEFQEAKESHQTYGHGVFAVLSFVDEKRSNIWIRNVCAAVRCDQINEHLWDSTFMHKGNPAMKCMICGFVWQANMRKPKVTCQQILDNPNKR